MNSKSASTGDFKAPLPARQFHLFLLIFHVTFIVALALTLYAHWRRVTGNHEPVDAVLVCLVTVQALCYLGVFLFLNFSGRQPTLRWWLLFVAVNVAIALAECRIERAFEWTLITYIGLVSALPLRFSVPATAAIFAAWLLNRFGWSALGTWMFKDWFSIVFPGTAIAAAILFMGRMVATSGERGQMILALEAAKRELELARERELELAALRERERLARDLHDTLGHAVVTLTVQLEAAQRLLAADPARVGVLLEEMQKLTRSSMDDLRRSLANLRTPGLGNRPLAAAVQSLCADAGQHLGAAIDCQLAAGADALPPAVAEALWRVVQEGLTNVERHAHAHRIAVNLDLPPKAIVLRISDDGVGMSSGAEDKPGHYGLRGLRERVEGLGGMFTVGPAGSSGTVIEARIPVIA